MVPSSLVAQAAHTMDILQANQRRDRSIVVSEQAHPHSDHTTDTYTTPSPWYTTILSQEFWRCMMTRQDQRKDGGLEGGPVFLALDPQSPMDEMSNSCALAQLLVLSIILPSTDTAVSQTGS